MITSFFMAMLLAGASTCQMHPVNPIVGVEVRREGPDYVFHFQNCFDPKKVIGIHGVTVKKLGPGERDSTLYCKITETPSGERELTEKWTYGTTPAGYRMAHCEPLKAGETYRADVSGAAGGHVVFSIANDGSVRMPKQACK